MQRILSGEEPSFTLMYLSEISIFSGGSAKTFFFRETCITTKYGLNVIIIRFTTSSSVVSFVF